MRSAAAARSVAMVDDGELASSCLGDVVAPGAGEPTIYISLLVREINLCPKAAVLELLRFIFFSNFSTFLAWMQNLA